MDRNTEIATEIKRQLGGGFAAMTGAHSFSATTNGLVFKLQKSQHMTIVLNGKDLYDITLWKNARFKTNRQTFETTWIERKMLKQQNDVHVESLQDVFTEMTGLYTTL